MYSIDYQKYNESANALTVCFRYNLCTVPNSWKPVDELSSLPILRKRIQAATFPICTEKMTFSLKKMQFSLQFFQPGATGTLLVYYGQYIFKNF